MNYLNNKVVRFKCECRHRAKLETGAYKRIRDEFKIKTRSFADHDVVMAQHLRHFPSSPDSRRWAENADEILRKQLHNDIIANQVSGNNISILPNTRLNFADILLRQWEYLSLFAGGLAASIRYNAINLPPKQEDQYFEYNYNGPLSFAHFLVPLLTQKYLYRDDVLGDLRGLIQLLQSTADLPSTLLGRPTISQTKPSRDSGYSSKKQWATELIMFDANQAVDSHHANMLKGHTKKVNLQRELALIEKPSQTYLVMDTLRDNFPRWTADEYGRSILHPHIPYAVNQDSLIMTLHTDGAASTSRSDIHKTHPTTTQQKLAILSNRHTALVSPLGSPTLLNNLGEDDDASILDIQYSSSPNWDSRPNID